METNKKILVNSAIFAIITLLLICFVIYPLLKGIKNNSENLIIAKKELILFQSRINNLQGIEKTYESWSADLEKIEQLFVNPEVPIDLIKFWERTATDSEVSIDISLVSTGASGTGSSNSITWSSISFQIALIGSFPNVLKFLEKIETSPYLIEIPKLTITGEKSSEEVRANLLIKVFSK